MYGRQSGLVPDGAGGQRVGSVVAVTEKSGESLAFVGQINARLGQVSWASFHASFGASVGDGVGDADVGLFLGPSVSFMRERVFLTLAYHYQETKRLGSTFKVGQEIPAEIEGDPPTSTRRVGGLLLTLSYKVR